jgi:phosphoenolpyruvate synthase/pyruvate phosphate dikinase
LRLVKDKKMLSSCRENDILIVEGSMIDIPPVAGIITTELQTPLSHISVLSVNRKIPSMAYVDALRDSALISEIGQFVQFRVTDDGFTVKVVALKNKAIKHRSALKPDCDLEADSLIGTDYLDRRSSSYVGNKAACFGELKKISARCGFSTPEGSFVIPFYFYHQHLIRSGADSLITSLVRDTGIIDYPDSLRNRLKIIRKRIESWPLDSSLKKAVEQRILSGSSFTRMRFRSSTNAEDMKGFSGAGLYESKTGILDDSVKTIDKAIQKVWASAWNYNAFVERKLFGIDQESVAMGILVHRSYPSEVANGVAITKNIYRPGSYGFTLNLQLGEETVVKPSDSTICEQILCYPRLANEFFKDKQIVEIISYSSLSPDKMILTEPELLHLANTLDKIKHHFHKVLRLGSDYLDFGLDIEFKYDGPQRRLYIDQVRLYND